MRKLHFLVVLLIPALVYAFADVKNENKNHVRNSINRTGIKEFGKGRLEYHYGIPFLYLEGNDYEVGLQYGTLLKEEMQNLAYIDMEHLKESIIQKEKQKVPLVFKFLVKPIVQYTLNKKRRKITRTLPKDIKERIKGMAEGSGISVKFYEEVFVMADYIAGCFSFVLKDDDRLIHARNFDSGKELLGEHPLIVSYNIKGKNKYIQLGTPSLLWSYSAVNEHGISFSEQSNNNSRYFINKNKDPLINGEKVLWHATSMSDVDSILQNFHSPNDFILNYVSAIENKGEVYDMIGGKIRAKTPIESNLCGTGGIQNPGIKKKFESIYSSMYHNMAREIKFEELVKLDTTINFVDRSINILSNTDFFNYSENPEVYYESINNYQTTQSVVFDAKNKTVYFAYYPYFAASSNWYKYDYGTNEISLYKTEDPMLTSNLTKEFVEVCKMKSNKSWSDKNSALQYIQMLESLKTKNLFVFKDLAMYYTSYSVNHSKAEYYCQKLMENYPDIVFGYYYMGKNLFSQSLYNKAIDILNRALTLKYIPEYRKMQIYKQLALCYRALDNTQLQSQSAKKALEIYYQYWQSDYQKDQIKVLENLVQ